MAHHPDIEDFLSDSNSENSFTLECEVFEDDNEVGVIEPYRFEPYLDEEEDQEDGSSDAESLEAEDQGQVPYPNDLGRLQNNEWCSCGHCQPMLTVEESSCCCEFEKVVKRKNKQPGIDCITEHTGFPEVCLSIDVLETAYYEYRQGYGPIPAGTDWKRYTAYRQFIRWVYHKLGRKIRVPIPSCVVNRIRDSFPADQYVGYQEAPDDD